jgi:hypothetical protein
MPTLKPKPIKPVKPKADRFSETAPDMFGEPQYANNLRGPVKIKKSEKVPGKEAARIRDVFKQERNTRKKLSR